MHPWPGQTVHDLGVPKRDDDLYFTPFNFQCQTNETKWLSNVISGVVEDLWEMLKEDFIVDKFILKVYTAPLNPTNRSSSSLSFTEIPLHFHLSMAIESGLELWFLLTSPKDSPSVSIQTHTKKPPRSITDVLMENRVALVPLKIEDNNNFTMKFYETTTLKHQKIL